MKRERRPHAEILLQTRGLQWPGQEWDVSRLLALHDSVPGLQSTLSKHKDGSKDGNPRVHIKGELLTETFLEEDMEKDAEKIRVYAEALDKALKATTCVLSVSGYNGLPHPMPPSRNAPPEQLTPFGMRDVAAVQPEFDLVSFPLGHAKERDFYAGPAPAIRQLEYNMTIRSSCTACYRRHDKAHSCCELASAQTGTSGLHRAERVGLYYRSLGETCALQAARQRLLFIPGSHAFRDDFRPWYHDTRITAIRERNNKLQRRVDSAVFQVLPLARIVLRPANGHYTCRLPLEIMMMIIEFIGQPVLTDAQIARLLSHAADAEGTQAVASVLYKAARPHKKLKVGKAFPEARRIMLRDEWLYNGGFRWEKGYEAAKRELGWNYTKDNPPTWPHFEDLDAVLEFLAFTPPSNARWPYTGGLGGGNDDDVNDVREIMEESAPWSEVPSDFEYDSAAYDSEAGGSQDWSDQDWSDQDGIDEDGSDQGDAEEESGNPTYFQFYLLPPATEESQVR